MPAVTGGCAPSPGAKHGLHIRNERRFAFIDDDGVHWDFADHNDVGPHHPDPWDYEADRKGQRHRQQLFTFWDALPTKNKAWYESFVVLPYENIIDIDEIGDEYVDGKHIFVSEWTLEWGPFWPNHGPVQLQIVERFAERSADAKEETRVKKFPLAP